MRKRTSLCSHLQESVLEIERLEFLALSLDRDLASTRTLSETVALEVVASLFVWIPLEANLGLGLFQAKVAPTTSSVLEPTQGNPTPFSLM